MITVREFKESDLAYVKELYEQYHGSDSDMSFPDLMNYLCSFVILDEHDDIIMAGAFRAIAELSLIINQDKSKVIIGRALREAKKVSMYLCEKFKIDEIHAFTKNEVLAKHINQHGFTPRFRAYSLKVNHGK